MFLERSEHPWVKYRHGVGIRVQRDADVRRAETVIYHICHALGLEARGPGETDVCTQSCDGDLFERGAVVPHRGGRLAPPHVKRADDLLQLGATRESIDACPFEHHAVARRCRCQFQRFQRTAVVGHRRRVQGLSLVNYAPAGAIAREHAAPEPQVRAQPCRRRPRRLAEAPGERLASAEAE